MKKFWKWLFGTRSQQLDIPIVNKCYCITYVVNGNLSNELKHYSCATSETIAVLNFWDTHDGRYYDILSVDVCNDIAIFWN